MIAQQLDELASITSKADSPLSNPRTKRSFPRFLQTPLKHARIARVRMTRRRGIKARTILHEKLCLC